ncbi:MAG: peptidase M64 N-terminal domain-containing protein, partial [Ignavibacteria bacterium]|nr:peptidase M64 N-terminal domain-containing protein [Ignavibacteria bacterium]
MKFGKILALWTMFWFGATIAQSVQFNEHFVDQTMRIDYFHIGDATTEIVTVDHIYQYGMWAGCTKNLIDNFNHGAYFYKVYDAASGKFIYSI